MRRGAIAEAVELLDLEYPKVTQDQRKELAAARAELIAEKLMDDADRSTAMQKRKLGKINPEVSAIGFGRVGLNLAMAILSANRMPSC